MKSLFSVSGIVIPASQRGRTLGFPTANLNISANNLPEGIFFAYANHQGHKYPALLFIGSALTFSEFVKKVEVYVLVKVENWYDQEIEVEALQRHRDNMKFFSADALVAQMKLDEEAAKKFFESLSQTS